MEIKFKFICKVDYINDLLLQFVVHITARFIFLLFLESLLHLQSMELELPLGMHSHSTTTKMNNISSTTTFNNNHSHKSEHISDRKHMQSSQIAKAKDGLSRASCFKNNLTIASPQRKEANSNQNTNMILDSSSGAKNMVSSKRPFSSLHTSQIAGVSWKNEKNEKSEMHRTLPSSLSSSKPASSVPAGIFFFFKFL